MEFPKDYLLKKLELNDDKTGLRKGNLRLE